MPKCQFYSNIAEPYIYQEFQLILPLVTASLYLRRISVFQAALNFTCIKRSSLLSIDAINFKDLASLMEMSTVVLEAPKNAVKEIGSVILINIWRC